MFGPSCFATCSGVQRRVRPNCSIMASACCVALLRVGAVLRCRNSRSVDARHVVLMSQRRPRPGRRCPVGRRRASFGPPSARRSSTGPCRVSLSTCALCARWVWRLTLSTTVPLSTPFVTSSLQVPARPCAIQRQPSRSWRASAASAASRALCSSPLSACSRFACPAWPCRWRPAFQPAPRGSAVHQRLGLPICGACMAAPRSDRSRRPESAPSPIPSRPGPVGTGVQVSTGAGICWPLNQAPGAIHSSAGRIAAAHQRGPRWRSLPPACLALRQRAHALDPQARRAPARRPAAPGMRPARPTARMVPVGPGRAPRPP